MTDEKSTPACGTRVDLWWADLTSADMALRHLLDAEERSRLEAMHRDADRGRFIVGAALLRVAVGAVTDTDPRLVRVARECPECGGPHGPPRVAGTRVSVAHAGRLIVVATAGVAVGVDVEQASRGADVAAWVAGEAAFKTGLSQRPQEEYSLRTRPVTAPQPGHLAALAVACADEVEVVVHGPDETGPWLGALAAQGAR